VPDSGAGPGPDTRPPRPTRTIGDAQSLQALAHPTRLGLMEAIALAGTLTATQASEVVGESPTACAYHLRVLGRLGFIEEAGGGRGRERPWRLAHWGYSIAEDIDDPDTAQAAKALSKTWVERLIARIRAFEVARTGFPADVQSVTGAYQSIVFATPAELARMHEELAAVVSKHIGRLDPAQRLPGHLPFEVVTFVHVLSTAGLGGEDAPAAPDP